MRTFLTVLFAIAWLGVGMASGATAAAGKLQVKLKPAIVLPSGEISLGQVAEVSAGNAQLAAELSALSVGNTPLAGNARTVTRDHVLMYLTRKGVRKEDVGLQGARACTVTVSTLKITGDQLVKCARDYLASMPVLQGNDTQIEVERVPRDKRIAVTDSKDGEPELIASIPSMDRPWGRVRVYVKIRRNDRTLSTIPVMFQVTSKQSVVYATKAVKRGDTLDNTALEVREVRLDATTANAAFLSDIGVILGKEASQSIAAGMPVLASMVKEPYAAMRGEDVSVVLRSRHIEIIAKGVALNDGHLGDVIPVTVGATGKRVVGKVTSTGTVEIPL